MRIIFIRHGKSIDDSSGISQRDDSPLSTIGVAQARKRAHDLEHLSPVVCYTSTYTRAQRTAEILFPHLQSISRSDTHEIKRPALLDGGNHTDAVHFWEVEHKTDKYDPDWTFDSSESFRDVTARAANFLTFITKHHADDETIVVVSHGGFIRHCIGVACKGEAYQSSDFFDLLFPMKIDNLDAISLSLNESTKPSWEKLNRSDLL